MRRTFLLCLLVLGCEAQSPAVKPVLVPAPPVVALPSQGTSLSEDLAPRYLPADSMAVLSLDRPAALLEQLEWRTVKREIELNRPGVVDQALRVASRLTQTQLRTPADWAQLGLDPNGSVGVAVREGGLIGFARIADRALVLASVRQVAGQLGQGIVTKMWGMATVITLKGRSTGLVLRDQHLFAVWAEGPTMAAKWAHELATGPPGDTLAELPIFQQLSATVYGPRGGTLWVRMAPMLRALLAEITGSAALHRAQLIGSPAEIRRLKSLMTAARTTHQHLRRGAQVLTADLEATLISLGLSEAAVRGHGRIEGALLALLRPADGPPLVTRVSRGKPLLMLAVRLQPRRIMGYLTAALDAFGWRAAFDVLRPRIEVILGKTLESAVGLLDGEVGIVLTQTGGTASIALTDPVHTQAILKRLMGVRPAGIGALRVGGRWTVSAPGWPELQVGIAGSQLIVTTDSTVFARVNVPAVSTAFDPKEAADLLAAGAAGGWWYLDTAGFGGLDGALAGVIFPEQTGGALRVGFFTRAPNLGATLSAYLVDSPP